MTARFSWGARTDVGTVREINQDSVHAREGLFVVADGMGGHRGGEVASAVAIESMMTGAESPVTTLDSLLTRVRAANEAIIDRARGDIELHGMGTTLCAVALLQDDGEPEPSRLGIINVGDSRVYRFADDRLVQITQDHSLVETLVREGRITAEEALNHPQRNILTRALGIGHDLEVDYWELPLHSGDVYLLCSDGLFNEVTDATIAETIRVVGEPAAIVDELVRLANDGGSRDNVTVVVARVDVGPDEIAPPVAPPQAVPVPGDAPITNEIPVPGPPPRFISDDPGFGDHPDPLASSVYTGDASTGDPDPDPEPGAPADQTVAPPGAADPAGVADPALTPPPPPAPPAVGATGPSHAAAAPPTVEVPPAPASEPPTVEAPAFDGRETVEDPILLEGVGPATPPVVDEPVPPTGPITPPRGTPIIGGRAEEDDEPLGGPGSGPIPGSRRPWWKFWGS